jgi:hypothetical protein
MAFAKPALLLGLTLILVPLDACDAAKASLAAPRSTEAFLAQLQRLNPTNRETFVQIQALLERDPASGADKRIYRGLKELRRLTKDWLASTDPAHAAEISNAWSETAAAMVNMERPPVPKRVDFFQTPWLFIKRLNRPVGRGRTESSDVRLFDDADSSKVDPLPSTFWQRPSDLPGKNLYYGFDRTNLLLPEGAICAYAGPKESFGRNPGFSVELQGKRLKIKFAEVSSEPFAARMFSALGYYVDPTDYVRGVRVSYSRAMLREFNSRKPLATPFTFLRFVPLFTLRLQQHYDPFHYIAQVVLTNGTVWSGADFKRQLFVDSTRPEPEADPANFRPGVESKIAYLETVPASVQTRVGKSIGPWDFGQLDHSSRRELRGAALLAGWLGWFDTRFDNTRLRIVKVDGRPRLRHVFSDLGGVLGKTSGVLYCRGELPNSFPWRFTRPIGRPKAPAHPIPFPLHGYKPITYTAAFAEMTLQDARWMGRRIGALTEPQITQALVASGFDSAQTCLYVEKLISRRDRMVLDLQLDREILLLRPRPINQRFSYNPTETGPVVIDVDGKPVKAAIAGEQIVSGRVSKMK